jgi:hypothetical protein
MSVFDQIVENQEKQIFYDTLGTFCTLQKQQEQVEQQQAILNEQKKITREQQRVASLPKCPACRKPNEHEAMKCSFCRSDIAYLRATPVSEAKFVLRECLPAEIKKIQGEIKSDLLKAKSNFQEAKKYLKLLAQHSHVMQLLTELWNIFKDNPIDHSESQVKTHGLGYVLLTAIAGFSFILSLPALVIIFSSPLQGICIFIVFSFLPFVWWQITKNIRQKEKEMETIYKKSENIRELAMRSATEKMQSLDCDLQPQETIAMVNNLWEDFLSSLKNYETNIGTARMKASITTETEDKLEQAIRNWPRSLKADQLNLDYYRGTQISDYTKVFEVIRSFA